MPLTRIGTGFALMWRGRARATNPPVRSARSVDDVAGRNGRYRQHRRRRHGDLPRRPGALFWMWCTALVGMATKYCEVVLAVHYREKDDRGEHVGGPMYAIKNGLGKKWVWLGTAFAIFGGLAGFGIGNMVQVNSMAHALETTFSVPLWATGLITMVRGRLVILGGIRRIGVVAASLVPFMCLA